MEVVVTAGAIRHVKLQSNLHHHRIITQTILQAGCHSCCPANSVGALKGRQASENDKLIFVMHFMVGLDELHFVAVITRPRNCIWKMLKKCPKNV